MAKKLLDDDQKQVNIFNKADFFKGSQGFLSALGIDSSMEM